MNLVPLTPVFVSLTLCAVMALGAREHHRVDGEVEIYRFPRALVWLMSGCSALFASTPLWPGVIGDAKPAYFYGVMSMFVFASLGFAAYLRKYRLVWTPDGISLGAFSMRHLSRDDVTSVRWIKGRGAELILTLQNGRKARISGLLMDFDTLASRVATWRKEK